MKILIIADVYPPEISSASTLIQELALGLVGTGDEVFIVTTFPKHYLADGIQPVEFKELSDEAGIKVIRVKSLPLKKVSFVIRGISQLILPFLIFRKVKKYIKGNLDGVIVYSPPLPLSLAGNLVKNKYGARFILNLQDIFPQNAIDLGVLKNKIIIKFFEAIEKFAYKNADIITFHSEGGRRFVIENKHVPKEKVVSLPNWVDFSPYGIPSKKDFKKEYGLDGKKVLLFAGIMGPAQGLEFLVEVAEASQKFEDIVFLLVGGGMEEEKIKFLVQKKQVKNIIFKNFISKDDYPDLVRSADVGIVCLSEKNKTPFVPGKFLGYMAAGKSVLAFLNKESDAFDLVKKAECGYAIESGNLNGAVAAIQKINEMNFNDLNEIGLRGEKHAKENFSLDSAIVKLKKFISDR